MCELRTTYSVGSFSVGDRVLVPGVVELVRPGLSCRVQFNDGDELNFSFRVADLRPDTGGRDLTAQDVEEVLDEPPVGGHEYVAEYLNRIARGDAGSARALSSSAGDVEPGSPAGKYCCSMMADNSVASCTEHSDEPASCPDVTIAHSRQHGPGLPIPNSAGGGQISIQFCPWCGADLAAGPRAEDTAPPAAEPKAWVTSEPDCHDVSCLFAASTHTHNDPRAAAGPRALRSASVGDTTPDDGLDVRSEIKRMIESNDRLRSEVAALRDAGNALIGAAEALRGGSSSNRRANLTVAVDAWRSAAGTPATDERSDTE